MDNIGYKTRCKVWSLPFQWNGKESTLFISRWFINFLFTAPVYVCFEFESSFYPIWFNLLGPFKSPSPVRRNALFQKGFFP